MNERLMRFTSVFTFALLMSLSASNAFAQEREYAAMEGVNNVQTVFDFRVGDGKVALAHLDLIHSMLKDPSMTQGGVPPEMVVVFIGPSVNLVSTDEGGATAEAKDAIARKISEMDADGARFEICMTTAHALEVSADSILPEIVQVGNGWISLVGYQHKGYAMIADL